MSHRVIDGGMASPSTASTAPTGMPEQNRANDNSLLLQRDNTTSQNEDSASLSSSNGRGYAADCSSSDSSSDVSSRQKQNQGEAQPTINEDKTIPGVDLTSDDANQTKDGTSLDGLRSPSFKKGTNDKTKAELHSGSEKGKVSSHVVAKIGALDDLVNQHRTTEPPVFLPGDRGQLPQWNGVRIMHPMDPRIDLSSVGHLTQVPVPVSDSKFAGNGMVVGAAAPPLENYLHLMEVRLSVCRTVGKKHPLTSVLFLIQRRSSPFSYPMVSLCLTTLSKHLLRMARPKRSPHRRKDLPPFSHPQRRVRLIQTQIQSSSQNRSMQQRIR